MKVTITFEDDPAERRFEAVRVLVTSENGDIKEMTGVESMRAANQLLKKKYSGSNTEAEGLAIIALAAVGRCHLESRQKDSRIII